MFVIVFLAVFSSFLYAQNEVSVEGHAAVSVGMTRFDLSALNSYMQRAGFSPFESRNISNFGVSIYSLLNNSFYTGISTNSLFGEGTESDSVIISVTGQSVFFDVGYKIFEKGPYRLTPLIGLGLSRMKINSVSKEVGYRGFYDALIDPAGNSSVVLPSMDVHFSILNSLMHDMHDLNVLRNNIVFKMGLSLRVGAVLRIGQQNWEIENQGQVVGGPDMGRYVLYGNMEISFGVAEVY